MLNKDVIIPTKDGTAEVRIKLKKQLRFLAKLKHKSLSQKDLEGHVIYRVVDDEAIFTVRPPSDGEYGLEIYANDKTRDGTTMHHIFQYLVLASGVKGKVEPWPQLPSNFMGPQGSFSDTGMTVGKYQDPLIRLDDNNLELDFKYSQRMKLMSQLICVSDQKTEDLSSFILQNTSKDAITFQIRFPKPGVYKFSLFGMPATAQGDNIPSIYNYLIECSKGDASAKPYPKQFSQWKTGCYLYQPTEGRLEGDSVKFRLVIDGASEVAVVIGNDWTQLTRNDNIWEGEADLAKHGGNQNKCVICANMDDNKATYSTLLEYAL